VLVIAFSLNTKGCIIISICLTYAWNFTWPQCNTIGADTACAWNADHCWKPLSWWCITHGFACVKTRAKASLQQLNSNEFELVQWRKQFGQPNLLSLCQVWLQPESNGQYDPDLEFFLTANESGWASVGTTFISWL